MLRSFDAETHCQARANNAFFRELIPSISCFLNDCAMEAVNRMVTIRGCGGVEIMDNFQ